MRVQDLRGRGTVKTLLKHVLPAMVLVSLVPGAAVTAAGPQLPVSRDAEATPSFAVGQPVIPAHGRYILVDTRSARLFMFEEGRLRGSMRVIVGKPSASTPDLTGTVYYATLNPYWYVPDNLIRTAIAQRVLKEGQSYLRNKGYEVVTQLGSGAEIIPSEQVDWKAVAEGRQTINVRQLPGPSNSMGRVKFSFGNPQGIYLHDTPSKALFAQANRKLSNGCIRLEDAPRLAHWLMERDTIPATAKPDDNVLLPKPVPITVVALSDPAAARLAALP
jgi:murein L,D-transpeptidase YcbB/YkuD